MSFVGWIVPIVLLGVLGGALWQGITLLRGLRTPRGIASDAANVIFPLGIAGVASSSVAALLPSIVLLGVGLLWSATLLLGIAAVIVAGARIARADTSAEVRPIPSWWAAGINLTLALIVVVIAVLAGR